MKFYAWAGYAMTGLGITLPHATVAQPSITTDSAVFVERSQDGAGAALNPRAASPAATASSPC